MKETKKEFIIEVTYSDGYAEYKVVGNLRHGFINGMTGEILTNDACYVTDNPAQGTGWGFVVLSQDCEVLFHTGGCSYMSAREAN